MKEKIIQFIKDKMIVEMSITVIVIGTLVLTIQNHLTLLKQQALLNDVILGKYPVISSKIQDKAVTYPFPLVMVYRWDSLIRELSKTQNLSKDFMFFPDQQPVDQAGQNLFKLGQ